MTKGEKERENVHTNAYISFEIAKINALMWQGERGWENILQREEYLIY